jgi:dolichyl-phosphate beta-glucosyltransferase
LDSGADIAIGSRAAGTGDRRMLLWANSSVEEANRVESSAPVIRQVLVHRHFIGRIFAGLVSSLFGLTFQDTQCGFKMCRASVVAATLGACRQDGFVFDVEWLYLARLQNLVIKEIPVSWSEVAGSKVSMLRDPLAMFLGLCRIRFSSGAASKVAPTPIYNNL